MKYNKQTPNWDKVIPYFERTRMSLAAISRETGVPKHGVRKMYKQWKEEQ